MVDENGGGPAFLKEGPDLSGRTNVRRPAAPHINPKTDEFTFMQIDTDYYTSAPPGNLLISAQNCIAYIKNASG